MRIITRSSEFLALAFDRLWPLSYKMFYSVRYKMFVLFFFDKLATEKIGYKLLASVQVV
jgi:hypothetical protein